MFKLQNIIMSTVEFSNFDIFGPLNCVLSHFRMQTMTMKLGLGQVS